MKGLKLLDGVREKRGANKKEGPHGRPLGLILGHRVLAKNGDATPIERTADFLTCAESFRHDPKAESNSPAMTRN